MSSTGSLDSLSAALASSSSSGSATDASAGSSSIVASVSSVASSSSSVSSSSSASSLSSSSSSSSESSSPSSAAASTSFSSTLTSSSLSFTTSAPVSQAPIEPSSASATLLESTSGPSQASPSVVTSGTPSDSPASSSDYPPSTLSPTASTSLSPQGQQSASASASKSVSPSTLEAVQRPSPSSSSSLPQDGTLASPDGQATRSFKTTLTARPSADWRNAQSASRTLSTGGSSAGSADGGEEAVPSSTSVVGGALQVSSSQDSPTPIAAGANPTSTLVYTAVWQTTLASNSGTATAGQVVDVTQVTTRGYGAASTTSSLPPGNTAAGAGAASTAHGPNMLVVVLVPVLVIGALLVPCILVLLRIRRRRAVRFMSTYEDLTGRRTSGSGYTDSLARDSESPFPYDMASIPSASMVHLDMARRGSSRAQGSRGASPADDPFADAPEDAHAPLFAEYAHGRSDSAGSRRSPSAASSRPASRWGTPVSRGAYSPAPTDSRAASRGAHLSVDLATPFEWDGMEDPFAEPNGRGGD